MPTPEREQLLGQLLESWFLKVENGEQVDAAAHCAQSPELLEEFERLLGHVANAEGALRPSRNDADAGADRAMLGEFELLGPIGEGGGGDVFVARQVSLARLVAVKRLRSLRDDSSRVRARREAEVAASLDHPNIVPIYAVAEEGDEAWIAMKWLTGPALDDLDESLQPRDVARIGAAIARALDEAHRAGIVHRDVKPSNVVFDGDHPYLVDFGLAREGEEVLRTTVEGHVSGTLLYMSPEQIRSSAEQVVLDGRTDVYSLGATMYELLAGHPPHRGEHPGEVIHGVLQVVPQPPACDRDLATIVMRALEKDRARRFPTALAMAEDLMRYLRDEPIESRPVGSLTRLWMLARRNRIATAAISVALVVALAFGALWLWDQRQQRIARDAVLARADQAIAQMRLQTAGSLLESLKAGDADDAVTRVRERLRASRQLERVLDIVQGRPEDVEEGEVAELSGLRADLLSAERRQMFLLAQPLLWMLAGRQEDARAALAALPVTRASVALTHALDGVQGAWELPAGASPNDHLFAALALRFAKRSVAARRAEVDAALAPPAVPGWRVLLQDAILMVLEERHEEAHRALIALQRDNDYPRIVRRLLLREVRELGRMDALHEHLRVMRQVHREQWTAADAGIVLYAMQAAPHRYGEEFVEVLRAAREQWPRDWYLAIVEASEHSQRGQLDRALQLLRDSVGFAHDETQRSKSRVRELSLRVHGIAAFRNPGRVAPSEAELAVLAEAQALADSLPQRVEERRHRADAILLAARSCLAGGEPARARELIERLPADDPTRALEWAHQSVAHAWARGSRDAWLQQMGAAANDAYGRAVTSNLRDALADLEGAIAKLETSPLSFNGWPAQADACIVGAFIAASLDEGTRALELLDQAEKLSGPDWPGLTAEIEKLRARIR